MTEPDVLTFLKLGGSLITDKTREATPRPEHLHRLANEVRAALDTRPDISLVLGHGSGSFGHFAGRRHGTRAGVHSSQEWVGYAQVSAVAARLNRLVTDAFLKAGVPVLSLQPSASARCEDGQLRTLETVPIQTALAHGLIPLLYGDVALDSVRGGTIVSTEEIFLHLAPILRPRRILLAGDVDGVLDTAGRAIPQIRPGHIGRLTAQLGGSHGIDVTGGMLGKVTAMLELVERHPEISVRIFSGLTAGEVQRALIEPGYPTGTVLTA
jgi:isopentenyl phosphate kinase